MRWPDWRAVAALLLVALAACAPRVTQTTNFSASFSDRGVIWVVDGQAFIALGPQWRVQRLRTPGPVGDVAWNGVDAWVALPSAGWVQRVTGTGGVVEAGAVVKLSAQRIYRQDGSALTYAGQPATGVLGTPDAVVTGGDGSDYVLQRGQLYRVGSERLLVDERAGGGYLVATPGGAVVTRTPALVTPDFTYRLTGTRLQRVDAAGTVRNEVPHGPALIGLVGDRVVSVSRDGRLRVFGYDLNEVLTQ